MIGISRLYCGTIEASEPLRYERHSGKLPSHLLQFSKDKKPVVVWNMTPHCNLRCRHCYASDTGTKEMMTLAEGKSLLEDLGQFGSPVVLFSGGEPLCHPDLVRLIDHARDQGLRAVISSNGTLITDDWARQFHDLGVSYVGISLDGRAEIHDAFRNQSGAYDEALRGIRLCRDAGVKVGLRFTITADNVGEIPGIFQLTRDEAIPRVCFYHLVHTGRAADEKEAGLDHEQTRQAVDDIITLTAEAHNDGHKLEVLTVDNHSDGVYLYQRMRREGHPRSADVLKLLQMNGGNSSGIGIGCVSWDGRVHPDQFWRGHTLGNVRERRFSEIWTDRSNMLMDKLKDRHESLEGRCGVCPYLDICNGNLRARAEAMTGNCWASDPGCYLSDKELQRDE